MKIAIVGSGAIGLYYGAMLVQDGQDVSFLMRSDLAAAQANGIRIVTTDGEFTLPEPQVFGATGEIGEVDLVIIALKATANDAMPELIAPLVGSETRILTLQNGLGNDALLAKHFPGNKIFGGLCFVCLNRIAPAVAQNFVAGSVSIGPRDRRDLDDARKLVELFSSAGVKTRLEENLTLVQWKKLVWNIPFNGLAVAAGGVATDVIVGNPELLEEARALMAEVIQAAGKLGCEIDAGFIEKQVELTVPMGAYRPSSMIDFVEGKPVEVEAIWGEPLRQGKAAGACLPKLEMLYALLARLCA